MNITIEDRIVKRGKKKMQVDQFCQVIAENCISGMRYEPIPDNVRWIVERGNKAVYIVELQPELRTLIWRNSYAVYDYDERSGYRNYTTTSNKYTVATPYVVLVIPFLKNVISGAREKPAKLFYRTSPLKSIDDQVLGSNLNNVLMASYGKAHIGCLCLDRLDVNAKMSRSEIVNAVVNHVWGGEFNHEYQDNFSMVCHVDERISSMKRWQLESKKNPNFALDVKWPEIDGGLTIRNLIDQELSGTANLGNLLLKIVS